MVGHMAGSHLKGCWFLLLNHQLLVTLLSPRLPNISPDPGPLALAVEVSEWVRADLERLEAPCGAQVSSDRKADTLLCSLHHCFIMGKILLAFGKPVLEMRWFEK